MSLSEHQVTLLRSSWEEIAKLGMKDVGLALFHQLFIEGDSVSYFHQLLPEGSEFVLKDMKDYPKLVSHGAKVASAIGSVVKFVDNSSELEALLRGMGRYHKLKEVPEKEFDVMEKVLLQVIKSVLEDKATDEVVEIWAAAYAVIKEGIVGQY